MTPPDTTGAQALSDEQEPTDEMLMAGRSVDVLSKGWAINLSVNDVREIYLAMRKAKPESREALSSREQAGVVACKRCHGSGSVEDGQITHHECGIPHENGPVQCMKDCPACNGAGKFFAAPGAAIAAREQEAAAYLMTRPSGFAWALMPKDVTPEWREVCKADGVTITPLGPLASREEAPAASAQASPELLRGWKRYEKLRKLTPAAFNRLHIVNVTGGTSFDDLVDALPEPSTPVPEQSAKGLTMGGEVDREA